MTLDLELKLEVESGLDSMSGIRPLAMFLCCVHKKEKEELI